MDEMNDRELLHRAKAGGFSAFRQLINQLQPRIYRMALQILQQPQDAEDVTQQTFLALIEHIQDFREESSLTTWALRITTNFALKILRKKRTEKVFSMSQLSSEDNYSDMPHPEFIAPWTLTAEEILQQQEIHEELDLALSQLDDKYRLVFILRDIQSLSVQDTAQALDLTESTVKVRLLRARLALRERLTKKFGDALQAITPDHKHS
ncbi:MAG: polymerase sigma factor SigW [Planctomycetota bacterium]|jgi:RNA polymerase sigma-70 factor (ECF subfamily)